MFVDEGYISFSGDRISFMIADSDEELHEMAGKLGLKREVFTGSHVYSIDSEVMEQALRLGAKLVDREVILGKLRR